jgi:hypothetical protein
MVSHPDMSDGSIVWARLLGLPLAGHDFVFPVLGFMAVTL